MKTRSWIYIKTAYLILGWIALLGVVLAVILPLVPAAPFLVLSGFAFSRGSESMHYWLRHQRFTRDILREWEINQRIAILEKVSIKIAITFGAVLSGWLFWRWRARIEALPSSVAWITAVLWGIALIWLWWPARPRPSRSLWIMGCGRLGVRVSSLWKQRFPTARLYAQTKTEARHAVLDSLGLSPYAKRPLAEDRFSQILIAVPPSEWQGDPRIEIAQAFARLEPRGVLVLVSSTAVYGNQQSGWTEELSSVSLENDRAAWLIQIENAVLADPRGRVVRLSGLYSFERGPQVYYLDRELSPEEQLKAQQTWTNWIWEGDAASLVFEVLVRRLKTRIFMGTDGEPVRRSELIALVNGDLGLAPGKEHERGLAMSGKRLRNPQTRLRLGWRPRFKSFEMWFKSRS